MGRSTNEEDTPAQHLPEPPPPPPPPDWKKGVTFATTLTRSNLSFIDKLTVKYYNIKHTSGFLMFTRIFFKKDLASFCVTLISILQASCHWICVYTCGVFDSKH